MYSTVLLIVLLLLLLGGVFPWSGPTYIPGQPMAPAPRPLYHGYGYGNPVGIILLVLLIAALLSFAGAF